MQVSGESEKHPGRGFRRAKAAFAMGPARRRHPPVLVAWGIAGIANGAGHGLVSGNWNARFSPPPDWLFGPVWTILYIAMIVAAWRVLGLQPFPAQASCNDAVLSAARFNAQLWSIAFFTLQSPPFRAPS